jgi:outer membrane protein assembly factor BamB
MNALERGDSAVVAAMLDEAEHDPTLESLLLKVNRLYQLQEGIAVHDDELLQARRFLSILREEAHTGTNYESLYNSNTPPFSITEKNGTIQERRLQLMQIETSPMPPNAVPKRKAAPPRMTRFPRAARFLQTAAAVLIVGALIAGFLLIFSLRHGTPRQTTRIGAQPSSPPGIYISRSDGVYRFNVQTHKVIWHTHVAGQSHVPGSPVVIGDTVYITVSANLLRDAPSTVSALDAQTGALRWSRDFPHSVQPPSLDDGLLYFNAGSPGVDILYAVNPATGSITAMYTPRQVKSWYVPVVVDGVLYYTDDFSGDTLYAVQLPSEKLLWQQPLSTYPLNVAAGGGIVVQNGIVYIPVTPETLSQNGWIDAFDAHTGKKLWQSPAITIADGGSTLAITNTMIYVASLLGSSGKLLAFDVHTHALVWHEPLEAFDMQVASGTLYIHYGVVSHVLYPPEYEGFAALDASTGKLLWKTNPVNGGVALAGVLDGVLYGDTWTTDGNTVKGTIYALNASTGTQLWTMPTGATFLQWGGMVVA